MALLKRKRSFWRAEILSCLRKAGFAKPTFLQQRIIPLILKGRDIAVEAEGGSGKTAAFILPLIMKMRNGKPGIKAVVLTHNLENSRKIIREFRRFSSFEKCSLSAYTLGDALAVKKEVKPLSRGPDVLIGTPERVIDHIRRGNISFKHLQTVIIDKPDGENATGFSNDVLFIYSKFPYKKQSILFSHCFEQGTDSLISVLKRPFVIPVSVWKESVPVLKHVFIEIQTDEKIAVLPRLIMAQCMDSVLFLCKDTQDVKKIRRILKVWDIHAHCLSEDLTPITQKKICKSFSVGRAVALVSTFEAIANKPLRWFSCIINVDLPPDYDNQPKSFVLRKIITLGTKEQYHQLKEDAKVQITKNKAPIQDEVIKGLINRILKTIKEKENPVELNGLRKIIRKNVPVPLRSYFMTYLFKSTLLPDIKTGDFSRLFISVGKNRKVFPKDLIALFTSALNIDRSRIGEIKILDNYSFIDIPSAYAEKAIADLSGTELKGRPITVNYARKKQGK